MLNFYGSHTIQGHNTCVYCRTEWKAVVVVPKDGGKGGKQRISTEGYVNVAHLQGQSQHRDTSTYSSWYNRYHHRW